MGNPLREAASSMREPTPPLPEWCCRGGNLDVRRARGGLPHRQPFCSHCGRLCGASPNTARPVARPRLPTPAW